MVQVAQLDDTGRGMSGNILSVNWDCGKTTTMKWVGFQKSQNRICHIFFSKSFNGYNILLLGAYYSQVYLHKVHILIRQLFIWPRLIILFRRQFQIKSISWHKHIDLFQFQIGAGILVSQSYSKWMRSNWSLFAAFLSTRFSFRKFLECFKHL